ncbi:MAG: SAM-dependent methyltransferase, partial [Clostridia bacterium]|nr:SAM-dependent methyltransferase [Clostridia bacterium]
EDVIKFCSGVAKKLHYDELTFLTGDIADYKADERPDGRPAADMVVTLHACDTATDYALINATRWGSSVILSVPCCQHELFSQITEPVNDPMLKHGIIKDKFTELLTDALRGLKLEAAGYDVNMIEFTSLEHTSKNIMIKAIRTAADGKKTAAMKKASSEYEALKKFYNVNPTIDSL